MAKDTFEIYALVGQNGLNHAVPANYSLKHKITSDFRTIYFLSNLFFSIFQILLSINIVTSQKTDYAPFSL